MDKSITQNITMEEDNPLFSTLCKPFLNVWKHLFQSTLSVSRHLLLAQDSFLLADSRTVSCLT